MERTCVGRPVSPTVGHARMDLLSGTATHPTVLVAQLVAAATRRQSSPPGECDGVPQHPRDLSALSSPVPRPRSTSFSVQLLFGAANLLRRSSRTVPACLIRGRIHRTQATRCISNRPPPVRPLTYSRSMSFASVDRRWVDQHALAQRDYLWKVYAWGSHRDAALMSRLELEDTVADFLPAQPNAGWGLPARTPEAD